MFFLILWYNVNMCWIIFIVDKNIQVMNFKDIFKRKVNKVNDAEERSFTPSIFDSCSLSFGSSTYTNDNALTLSAVYRAVNCISDAVAQLPLEIYKIDKKGYKVKDRKNPSFNVLNNKPNRRMNRYTFISLLVQSMLLKGNAYSYIVRDEKGNVQQLIYIPSDYVSIIPPKTILEPIKYKITGINGTVEANEMIHILNQTFDGVIGISTLQYARHSLGIYHDTERFASNFFSSGCALGGFIKSDTSLTPKQKEEIKSGFKGAFGRSGESNGLAVLEGNLHYEPITVNPADSMMLQNREFSIVDVARWFGLSPTKIGDLSKSSYSTLESSQLAFLTDTVSPLLEKIELEFETKLFPDGNVDIRFDVSQLLRADRQSLAQYYSTLIQNGVMQINEVRRELDLPSVDNGNVNLVPVNLQTLDKSTSNNPETSQDIKEKLNK